MDPFGNAAVDKKEKSKPAKKPTDPQIVNFLKDLYELFKGKLEGINLENIKQAFMIFYKMFVKFLLVGSTIFFMNDLLSLE